MIAVKGIKGNEGDWCKGEEGAKGREGGRGKERGGRGRVREERGGRGEGREGALNLPSWLIAPEIHNDHRG